MKAFNFSLFDQNSKLYKLSDYLGKWVVVYFYPKDDTSGCTKEACSFSYNIHIIPETACFHSTSGSVVLWIKV